MSSIYTFEGGYEAAQAEWDDLPLDDDLDGTRLMDYLFHRLDNAYARFCRGYLAVLVDRGEINIGFANWVMAKLNRGTWYGEYSR